ncbi:MAG: hypothetical protein ACK5KO_02985 [Arachnia sp.]
MGKWLWRVIAAAAAAPVLSVAPLAAALPIAPDPIAPVAGIPEPCQAAAPWPGDDASIDELTAKITENWGFSIAGSGWTEDNRESIKIVWETLDAMNCTPFLTDLKAKVDGKVGLNATRISGYAWGDWSLTKAGYVSFDFTKFAKALDAGDEGRLVRLVTHELAHVLNADRYSSPEYWKKFQELYAEEGRFSDYAGSSVTETFADVVGYYAGRCALHNPYDTGEYDAYYEFVKQEVFGGHEFGPPAGERVDCAEVDADAEEPQPGPEAHPARPGDWIESLREA